MINIFGILTMLLVLYSLRRDRKHLDTFDWWFFVCVFGGFLVYFVIGLIFGNELTRNV